MNPETFARPGGQRARAVVGQQNLHRLCRRPNASVRSLQDGLLPLNDRHTRVRHAQNRIADLDANLARALDHFQVGGAAVGVAGGRVRTQVNEAFGIHVQAVGQHVERVLLHHRQRPGGFVQRHVVALGRHDGQSFVGRQLGSQAQARAVRAQQRNHHLPIVAANLATRAQHHAVAHHVGLFNAGLGVGAALGKHRLGQGALQLGVRPLGQRTHFGLAACQVGGVHGRNHLFVAGLVGRGAVFGVQCQHLGRLRGFHGGNLRLADPVVQILLAQIGVKPVAVVGRDRVGLVAGHVAVGVCDHVAHIAQAPVAPELRAGGGQRQLPAGLGRRALQRRLVPQRQQLGFGALVARLVAVVVDQIARRLQIHIAAGGHLVHPQVARHLFDGHTVARIGRQAAVGRVARVDVQGGLDGAIGMELANAAARCRQINAVALHMHRAGRQAHDAVVTVQPHVAGGRHLVDAQGATGAAKRHRTRLRLGGERTGARDHVDRRSLGANAGLGQEAEVHALHHRAGVELADRAVDRLQRHRAAGVADVAAQANAPHAFDVQRARVVAHQLDLDVVVSRHTLGEDVFQAHFGAAVHVIGFLDAQEAALAPRAVVNFFLSIGRHAFGRDGKVAPAHRYFGAHVHVFHHGVGGLDVGVHAVPFGAVARNETQPRRGAEVVALLGHELVAGRPRIGAVGQRAVAETRLHAAARAGDQRAAGGDQRSAHPRALGHLGLELAVGVALVGRHRVSADRAVDVFDRLAQVGDADHARVATGVQPLQVQPIGSLVVDVDAGVTVERAHHTTAGVDDRPHQLHQATLHVGGRHFQHIGLGVVVHDGLQPARGHGGQRVRPRGRADLAVGVALVDLGLAVGGQRPAELDQRRPTLCDVPAPVGQPGAAPVGDLGAHRGVAQDHVVVGLARLHGAVDVEVARTDEDRASGIHPARAVDQAIGVVGGGPATRAGRAAGGNAQVVHDILLVIAVMHRIQRLRRAAHRLADGGRREHEVLARRHQDFLAVQARHIGRVFGIHRNAARGVVQRDRAELVVEPAVHTHLGCAHLVFAQVGPGAVGCGHAQLGSRLGARRHIGVLHRELGQQLRRTTAARVDAVHAQAGGLGGLVERADIGRTHQVGAVVLGEAAVGVHHHVVHPQVQRAAVFNVDLGVGTGREVGVAAHVVAKQLNVAAARAQVLDVQEVRRHAAGRHDHLGAVGHGHLFGQALFKQGRKVEAQFGFHKRPHLGHVAVPGQLVVQALHVGAGRSRQVFVGDRVAHITLAL